jgi:hypothetical protein
MVGPLVESSSRHKYALTLQDELSKFTVAISTEHQRAQTTAREFVLNIVLRFGTPRQILTDHGSNFVSNLFKKTCELLKVKTIHCSAFHRQTGGMKKATVC